MTGFTRREFLKRAGLIGAAVGVPAAPSIRGRHTEPVEVETVARVFSLTPVYQLPDATSDVIGQLAPDSVHNAIQRGGWYRVDSAYVPRTALQPILSYVRPALENMVGFYAQLVAPVSAIRKWCAAQAPIVARLGFGAVSYVVDMIVDGSGQVWYGLAADEQSGLIGWSMGLHWEKVGPHPNPSPSGRGAAQSTFIKIDTRNSLLKIYQDDDMIGYIEIYSPILKPTKTVIRAVQPGASIDIHTPLGLPWLMQLETGQRLHGAFWHNRFGSISESDSIELPPLTARYLYGLVLNPVNQEIEVEIV